MKRVIFLMALTFLVAKACQGLLCQGGIQVCVTGNLYCADRGILCRNCSRRHSPMCPHLVHDAIKHMAVWPMTQIVHQTCHKVKYCHALAWLHEKPCMYSSHVLSSCSLCNFCAMQLAEYGLLLHLLHTSACKIEILCMRDLHLRSQRTSHRSC